MPNTPLHIPKLSRTFRAGVSSYDRDKDNDWVQYVEDHRRGIILTSKTMSIDPEVMGEYVYRPMEFASEYLNLPNGTGWIFTYINDIHTFAEFDYKVNKIYVPDVDVLSNMRQKFKVHMANIERNNKSYDRKKR